MSPPRFQFVFIPVPLLQVWRIGIVWLALFQFSISPAISHPVEDDFLGDLVGPVQTVIVKAESSMEDHQFHHPMVQTYHFDSPGQLSRIEFDITGSNRDDSWPRTMTYTYDAAGNKLKALLLHGDGWLLRTVYIYNPVGQMTAKVTAYGNGQFSEVTFFIYNDRSERTQELFFNRDHGFQQKVVYENQRPKTIYLHPLDDQKMMVLNRSYSAAGRLVEEEEYTGNGKSRGNTLFRYDERGNVLETLTYSPEGTLVSKVTHLYEYDPMGNWITDRYTSEIYFPGELISLHEETIHRTFVYHSKSD
jgi:hypothetical protein